LTTENTRPSSGGRQADVRDCYGYQVLRRIFGEEAARDFMRVEYRLGVAENEVVEGRSGDINVPQNGVDLVDRDRVH
jgi:hypothetical protein